MDHGYYRAVNSLIRVFEILHSVGIALLLIGVLLQIRAIKSGDFKVSPLTLYGALTMLASGMGLVGGHHAEGHLINNFKIGVKLVVLMAILLLVLANRKKKVSGGIVGAIGGLTVANVLIASLWT
jgi:hypothetical protein